MSDPANNDFLPRHSPTASSADASSSSDLDTESTGSFFHDRSTTLGTLMGVTFPSLTFRTPSQHRHQTPSSAAAAAAAEDGVRLVKRRKGRRKSRVRDSAAVGRKRKWWRLCRDDGCRPTSLGEFLEIERRFGYGAGGGGGFCGGEARGVDAGRALFQDGRVLPPADAMEDADAAEGTPDMGICRFAASLTGICSSGLG
ncbi:hypothetical protein MLD38_028303 [Melastoma candidum]|uniref:Uncharacterized protein n=1 Tax=Melastoma candidum TaxID=119954 RepID=A0ACB9N1H3_9MYRT|nr:hypothetical protein MLD38_028303 [Melastoma candidum]